MIDLDRYLDRFWGTEHEAEPRIRYLFPFANVIEICPA
jgi:hypothetical protein